MKSLFILFSSLIFCAAAQGQAKTAVLHDDGRLEIPEGEPVADSYEFDISDMAFQNEGEAVEFFRVQAAEAHFIRPVLSQNKAVLFPDKKAYPDRTAQQWNAYFSEHPITDPSSLED